MTAKLVIPPDLTLCAIAAVARNGVIGKEGGLPWRLSSDLQHFRNTTMGHHIIMGRKNFESIGKVLPGRTTVVLSHKHSHVLPSAVILAPDLQFALDLAKAASDSQPFVVGGAQIYALAMPSVNRFFLTRVLSEAQGEILFPRWQEDGFADGNPQGWTLKKRSEEQWDAKANLAFVYEEWCR